MRGPVRVFMSVFMTMVVQVSMSVDIIVSVTMGVRVPVIVQLPSLFLRLQADLHDGPRSFTLRRHSFVAVTVGMVMCVIMIMRVRHCIVMMVAAHAVFHAELAVLAAVARHTRLSGTAGQVVNALLKHLKYLALEAKVVG